jgi:hypothetical protein
MSSSDNWSWNASMWVNYHKQKAEKQVWPARALHAF